MPDSDGHRTTNEWLQTIYQENGAEHREIRAALDLVSAKLDSKVDKETCTSQNGTGHSRIGALEKRTRGLEAKQAGISAAMVTLGIWIKSVFIG